MFGSLKKKLQALLGKKEEVEIKESGAIAPVAEPKIEAKQEQAQQIDTRDYVEIKAEPIKKEETLEEPALEEKQETPAEVIIPEEPMPQAKAEPKEEPVPVTEVIPAQLKHTKEEKRLEKKVEKGIAISKDIEEKTEKMIETQEKMQEELKPLEGHRVGREPNYIKQVIEDKLSQAQQKEKESTEIEKIIDEIQVEPEAVEKAREEMSRKEDTVKIDNLLQEEPDKKIETILEETAKETPKAEPVLSDKNETEVLEEKRGFFSKIFEKQITEEDANRILKELQIDLMENDVAVEVAEKICNDVKQAMLDKTAKRGKVSDIIEAALRTAMLDVMKQDEIDLEDRIEKKDGVFTIMFLGFNGTGKTTTLAKFAKKFIKYKPVVAAADTFRAASIEQLEEHSRRVGFRVVKHQYGSDSAAVIFDAKKAAEAAGSKLVLADTAGRSHSNVNLMDELKKIVKVNQPDLKILILDAVTGNDIYEQSKLFNEAVGVDAIILTKTDVYEKGGAALSAAYTIKKPILYLGVGQEYADLKEFNPEEIVKNILE